MNTIYDGTYVIGQTSATNYVAGPGIKIDEPTVGTVRIGNDETVLFSGSSNSTINLTESPLNFETIKVFYHAATGDTDMGAGSHEFQPNKTHIVILTNKFMWKENQTEYINMNEALLSLSGVNTTSWGRMWGGWHNVSNIAGTALNNSYDFLNISKVVGINRISGGNA